MFGGQELREYLFTNDAHALSCPDCFAHHVFGGSQRDFFIPLIYIISFILLFIFWFFVALFVINSGHYIVPLSAIKAGTGNAIIVLFPYVLFALFALGMAHWISGFILKIYRWSNQTLYLLGEAEY